MARLDKEQTNDETQAVEETASRPRTVGALLRATREERREDLRSVAEVLRIRYAFLRAIEEEQYAELPGPTYAVGFVRAYAEHLGLDHMEIARRFKEEGSLGPVSGGLQFPTPANEASLPTRSIILVSVALALVVYGGWTLTNGLQRPVAEVVEELPARIQALLGQGEAAPDGTTPPADAPSQGNDASPADPEPAPEPIKDRSSASEAPVDRNPQTASAPSAPPQAAPPPPAPAAPPPAAAPAPVDPSPVQPSSTPRPVTGGTAPLAAGNPLAVLPSYPQGTPAPQAPGAAAEGGHAPAPSSPTPATPATPSPATPASPSLAARPTGEAAPAAATPTPPPVPQPAPTPAASPAPTPSSPSPSAPVAADPAAALPSGTAAPAAPPAPVADAGVVPTPVGTPPSAQDLASLPEGRVYGEENRDVRVLLRAQADSWVQVREGSDLLLTRLLKRGDTYRVPNRPGVTLMTGNAGGLVVMIDGKPSAPLGRPGDVLKGITLDAEKLKAAAAGTN